MATAPAVIVVVSTGGTIAMRPDPATGKLVPATTLDELLESLSWPDAPPLELDDFVRVPSFDMHGPLALSLARRVLEHRAPVVVTHGTDTMEESVFLIDRLLPDDAPPVVLTGAQRPADEIDRDGPRNLRDAIRVAGSPGAGGRGAMIVFGGEIHAARDVCKVHTSAVRAFASPGYGPIGHVDGERVVFSRRPERRALPADGRRVRGARDRPRGHRAGKRERAGRRGGARGGRRRRAGHRLLAVC